MAGENGMRVNDLIADVVMEYKLTSYRVHMASTKAILNLDADAMLLDGDEIIIEDGDDGVNNDPRIGEFISSYDSCRNKAQF